MGYFREKMFRLWYAYVSRIDKNADVIFMNYGYHHKDFNPEMADSDEKNRYSAQLYHLLGSAVDMQDKSIAEIGCGRGGGLSYFHRTFKPAKSIGVDLNALAIKFCQNTHKHEGMSFYQGDAQTLPFLEDASIDAILNVESSHRYPRMDLFLNEVHRILKPGGHFLFTDFRYKKDVSLLKQQLADSGLQVVSEASTNDNVVSDLQKDDHRRRNLVRKLVPFPLHKAALNFAGAVGSDTYNMFANGGYQYFFYVLRKN